MKSPFFRNSEKGGKFSERLKLIIIDQNRQNITERLKT